MRFRFALYTRQANHLVEIVGDAKDVTLAFSRLGNSVTQRASVASTDASSTNRTPASGCPTERDLRVIERSFFWATYTPLAGAYTAAI